MAIRINNIQSRSGYIGTGTNIVPNIGDFLVSGDVGIGNTIPGSKLDVSGNINSGGGYIRINGDSYASAYTYGFFHDGTNLQGTTQTNLFYAGGTVLANTTIADWSSFRIEAPSLNSGSVITNNYAINQVSSAQINLLAGTLFANNSIFLGGSNKRFYANGGGATNWRGIEVNSTGLWSWGETGIGNYFSKKVGIGTTSIIGNFNINGGTGDAVAQDTIQTFTRTSSTGNVLAAKIALIAPSTYQQNLVFKIKTTASSAENDSYYTNAMTIGYNSNVSIGTDTVVATAKLQVLSSIVGGNAIYGLNYDGAGAGVKGQTYRVTGTGTSYGVVGVGSNAGTQAGTNIGGYFEAAGAGTSNYALITGAGNVGIGTGTPLNKMHIVGPNLVRGTETSYALALSSSTTPSKTLVLGYDETNDVGIIEAIHQQTAWKNLALAVSGSPNVGIGEIAPTAKLHIKSSGNAVLMKAQSAGYMSMDLWGATNGGLLSLYGGGASPTIALDGRPGYHSYFTTDNVGIGVTSPQSKLQIFGTDMPAQADAASTETLISMMRNGSPDVWRGGASFAVGRWSTGGGTAPLSRLDINLKNTSDNSTLPALTVMSLLDNGRVGIGTVSPLSKLFVQGVETNNQVGNGNDSVIQINNGANGVFGNLAELIFSASSTQTSGRLAAISSAYTGWDSSGLSGDLKFSTRSVGSSFMSVKMLINSEGALKLSSYNSTSNLGTPTYLLGTDLFGNVVKTQPTNSGQQLYVLPSNAGVAAWKLIGRFTASSGGKSVFIKMVTNAGYNSSIDQNAEVYLRFKTSNGNSVDPNGFSGDGSLYSLGANGGFSGSNFKWVANAAGVAATSFDLYMNMPPHSGNGGFYTVDTATGTWTPLNNSASDPGAASSTIMIPVKQFTVGGSDLVVGAGGNYSYFGNGNLGVGTTNPGSNRLNVVGNTLLEGQLIVKVDADSALTISNAGTDAIKLAANTGDELYIGANASWAVRMSLNGDSYFDNGGKVGVGTSTIPALAKLLVEGAIVSKPPGVNDYYSYLRSNWASDGAFELGIQGAGTVHKLITSGNYYHGTHLNLWTSDQKRLVIDSLGNVGVGTTNPAYKFVASNGGALGFEIDPAAASGEQVNILTYNRATMTYKPLVFNTSKVNFFGGNISILNSNNTYALDVSGTIRATGDVIAYSDARVKDNVETIENALNKVTQLRGVSYTRNDIEDKSTKIGVIAQEILEVVPEVVQQDDEGKYSVAYGNMVGLLIESIKELKAEVDELKSRI